MASEYNYDEEGETWPFFLLAMLAFILLPLTVKWIHRVIKSDNPLSYNRQIPGAILQDHQTLAITNHEQISKYQSKQKSAKIFNKTLLTLIVGWGLFIYIALNFTKEANLEGTFDPYAILDVAITASEREIKSRYRKLSLKFHPDKLPKDVTEKAKEEMEAAFIKINLAYKALTDEVTKRNFLTYGHPDGPQDVAHGIAIPKFLVEGKFSPFMIVFYFFLIGILLPTIVGVWWNNVKSYNKKGIHVDTAAFFVRKMADRNPGKVITPYDLLDWLTASQEIRTNFKHLGPNKVRELMAKYLFRQPVDANLDEDKLKIISMLPSLLSGLIDIATAFRVYDIVLTATDLQKSLMQGVLPTGKYQDLLQLPYVDSEVVSSQPVKKLGKLFTLSNDEVGKVLGISDTEKVKHVLDIAAHIPTIRVLDANFKVPGETVVPPASNAHLSVKFLIKSPKHKSCPEISPERLEEDEDLDYLRNPLKVNEEQPILPYSFCPQYPGYVRNSWTGFLINQKDNKLAEGSEIYHLTNADLSNLELTQDEWISGEKAVIGTFKIALPTPTPNTEGTTHYRLVLKNNSYFGGDVDIPVALEVKNPPLTKEAEERIKAKLARGNESDSDSDSDISDPEEDSLAGALAALRGGAVKKSAAKDDESDESDNESVFTDIDTDTEDES